VPDRFRAFHWHGDAFDLPQDATPLFQSERTPVQGFSYAGVTLGLLCHLEAGVEEVRAMARAFPEELAEVGTSEGELMMAAETIGGAAADIGRMVFARWLSSALARGPDFQRVAAST
jgi:GMP synthase (glutamine-hydrolysing)